MRINIVSLGRFHVADLARCLADLGHDVKFYSDVPRFRLKKFGLTNVKTVTFWPLTFLRLFETALKKCFGLAALDGYEFRVRLLDYLCVVFMRKCDVIIGMAGISHFSAEAAKRRGAVWWLERSSRHIQSQKRILESLSDNSSEFVSDWMRDREKIEYEKCDRIVVPSHHVLESFVEEGINADRIFVNPLGVDLKQFPFSPVAPDEPLSILMVGRWSRQKGCDLLLEAWKQIPEVQLIHVGPCSDMALPEAPHFVHLASVDQSRLWQIYKRAHVLALPSYQDGFGLVMSQALACGVLVVCSDRTGGPDIRERFPQPERIEIFRAGDAVALRAALERQLERAKLMRNHEIERSELIEALSSEAYARRYHRELTSRL